MTISLIRIRQARRRQRIVEANTDALRVGKLDVLHNATGQISVCSINSGVEYRHRDTASTHRQSAIRPREVSIAPSPIDAGDAARARVEIPLECTIAVDRSHGRQMRNRRNARLARGDSDHRQRTITRPAEYADVLQIRNV